MPEGMSSNPISDTLDNQPSSRPVSDVPENYDETPAHTTTSHIGPVYDANGNIIESTVVESRVGGTVTTTTVTTSSASRRGSTASTTQLEVPSALATASIPYVTQPRGARVTGGVASLVNSSGTMSQQVGQTYPVSNSAVYSHSQYNGSTGGFGAALHSTAYNTTLSTGYHPSTAYSTGHAGSVAGVMSAAYSATPSMAINYTSNLSTAGTTAMSQGTVISKDQLSALTQTKEEQVSYVEVEVEEERIVHVTVPKYETKIVHKPVPREEWIDKIEEVVEYKDVVVEVLGPQQIVENWRDVETEVVVEKPVEKPVYKPVVEIVTREEPRQIEVLEIRPKPVQVPVRYNVPVVRDNTQAVVVAQTFQPVLGVSHESMVVNVRQWEFTPVHIDVPIPKAVPIQVKMGQWLRTTHEVVSVPAAQWNTLVQNLNASALAMTPEIQALLPFVTQIGTNYVPMLPAGEPIQMVTPNSDEWKSSYAEFTRRGQTYAVVVEPGYTFTHVEHAVSQIVSKRREMAQMNTEMEVKSMVEQANVQIQREQEMVEERNRITMQTKKSYTGTTSTSVMNYGTGMMSGYGQNYSHTETTSLYPIAYGSHTVQQYGTSNAWNNAGSGMAATSYPTWQQTNVTSAALPGALTGAGTAASRFNGMALGDVDDMAARSRQTDLASGGVGTRMSLPGSNLPGHFNGSLQTSMPN